MNSKDPMFIISNLHLKGKLEKKTVNGRTTFEVSEDNITQRAQEVNEKVAYFVLEEASNAFSDNQIKNDNLGINNDKIKYEDNKSVNITLDSILYTARPCKTMSFETFVKNEQQQESVGAELGVIFGTKRRKDAIIKSQLHGTAGEFKINIKALREVQKLNVEQILPKLNLEAGNPHDAFKIELILEDPVVRIFAKKSSFDPTRCHQFLKPFVKFYCEEYETHFYLLEGLAFVLERPTIRFNLLKASPIFSKEVLRALKKNVAKSRLQPLVRDKYVCTFYILLLMVSAFKLDADHVPRFELPEKKFFSIIHLLGCRYNTNSGVIEHHEMPKMFVRKQIRNSRR